MLKYTERKRTTAYDTWDEPHMPSLTVFEAEGPSWTGLYDHKGEPLYRAKEPMGFLKGR